MPGPMRWMMSTGGGVAGKRFLLYATDIVTKAEDRCEYAAHRPYLRVVVAAASSDKSDPEKINAGLRGSGKQ